MKNNIINIAIIEKWRLYSECIVPSLSAFKNLKVIIEASDDHSFLTAIEKCNAKPDVILLDSLSLEMDCVSQVRTIRKKFPQVKIIIISVFKERRRIIRLVKENVNGFLSAAANLDELRQAIEMVFNKGIYYSEEALLAMQEEINRSKRRKIQGINQFTIREKQVMNLICKGFLTKEIAEQLCISNRTVEGHRYNLLDKTGVRNAVGLVIYALKNNIIDFDSL